MTGGVDVKMGVSGVAQFKKNIGDAKQAVKTLDAQLQLTEKQFKANGDAEEYMTKKSAELEAKLEAQKRVVDNAEKALNDMAEKGVDKSSKAYQDMYRTMLQAKGELLDTETALDGVAAAGEDAASSTKGLSDQMAEVSKGVSWQNVTDGLEKISSGMSNLMKKAWQTGEAIVKATLGAGSWADELKTTAAQLSTDEWEVTPEDLQRMQKTATIIDTDVETIVGARSKLLKGLGNESKGTMSALAFLGIDAEGKDKMDVFWEAGEALMKVGDEAEQEAQATALFGKSWKELKPLFAAGREEYDKTMASWSVVTNDQVDSLGKMDDAYQKMNAEWETFKMQLLSTFSGPMTEGMETITGLFKELNTYLQTEEGQAMLKQIGDTISTLISDLVNINPEDVINSLKGIIDGITNGLKWISEHKSEVVLALEAIGIGFAGLKIATFGLNIAKTVSGFKNLLGGNGTPDGGTPSTTGGTPVTTGGSGETGGGGLLTGAWATIKSGAATAGQTLAFLSPLILAVDGFVHDAQLLGEMSEKGEESLQRTAEMTEKYKDNDLFNIWDTLNDYLTVSGDTASDKQKMDAFAERYMAWMNDEVQDPMLDKLSELMEFEDFDAFTKAMQLYSSGTPFYSDEDREAFSAPLFRMLEYVEQELEKEENGANALTKEEILGAVKEGMSEAPVNAYLDGELVTNAVSRRLAAELANRRYVP